MRVALPLVHHVGPRARACHITEREHPALGVFLVLAGNMLRGVLQVDRIPGVLPAARVLDVIEQDIRNVAPILAVVVDVGSLPGDFGTEVLGAEQRSHHQLQVMRCRGIAVQVDAPGRLHDPAEFNQAHRHHHQVRKHVVFAKNLAHRLDQVGELRMAAAHHLFVSNLRFLEGPVPGIFKCHDLRRRLLAGLLLFEEDVVAGVAVERRVQVDQIHTCVGDVLAEHVKVVAKEQLVLPVRISHGTTIVQGFELCATLRTMSWISLKKGGVGLHVAYAHTFTNNLIGHATRVRTQPSIEIAFDLNPNLHVRNKSENSYLDARELADGELASLKVVQIDDDYINEKLARALDPIANRSDTWTLTIELEGTHSFQVRPEVQRGSLFLSVVSDK